MRKATAVEPGERYSSVANLLNDLRLFKAHVPISARADSLGYRFRKFARRHYIGATFSLLLFGVLSAFGAREFQLRKVAQDAFEKAAQEAEASRRISEFLTNLFSVTDPSESRGNSVTARELLDKGAQQIEQELADQPLIASQLMRTMGQAYYRLGLYPRAEPVFDSALTLRQTALESDDAELGRLLFAMGSNYTAGAKFEEAEQFLNDALALQENSRDRDDAELAETLRLLGNLYLRMGRTEEAEAVHLRGIPLHEKSLGADHPKFADHLASLSRVYFDMGRNEEAEKLIVFDECILHFSLRAKYASACFRISFSS